MSLIPPTYVKPFVRRGKTDAADAEAMWNACFEISNPIVATSMMNSSCWLLHRQHIAGAEGAGPSSPSTDGCGMNPCGLRRQVHQRMANWLIRNNNMAFLKELAIPAGIEHTENILAPFR
jgi:hypothetical protein